MSATDPAGSDRVLPATRWVAIAIIPFLAVAAVLLFAVPGRSGELFAWQINPPLSAFLLASAYVGGIWFFVHVAVARRWHRVRHGFPAVVVFAGALLVATLLHLDRFSQNLSFVVWMILYATTPFVVAALAVAQRRSDPRTPESTDLLIPSPMRVGLAVIGAAALLTGAVIFVFPGIATPVWAWELTDLTARVTGAVLSLTGVVNLAMLTDRRCSAFRTLFQAQLISLVAIAVSLIVRRDDLRWEQPATAPFVALIAIAILSYGAFTVWCEVSVRQRNADSPVST